MRHHFQRHALAAMTALTVAAPAAAAVQWGDNFTFSAFGTVAGVRSDDGNAEYIREYQAKGAKRSFDFGTDSNLGLQLTWRPNEWLSATVQTLTKRRAEVYNATQVEWAFVKLEPLPGLAIRAGRTALPTFAISDSRNVGYANPWVHSPNEIYGIAYIDQLRGVDVSYSHGLGDGTFKVTGLAGESVFVTDVGSAQVEHDFNHLSGYNLSWENDWLSLRFGSITGNPQLDEIAVGERFTFSGFGATVNRGGTLLQAEYVRRHSSDLGYLIDTDAWYVLGAHRFGKFQPFVSYSKLKPGSEAASGTAAQTTLSAGVRWDFRQAMDLKLQLDHIDTQGTSGNSFTQAQPDFDGKANVISVALDFAF